MSLDGVPKAVAVQTALGSMVETFDDHVAKGEPVPVERVKEMVRLGSDVVSEGGNPAEKMEELTYWVRYVAKETERIKKQGDIGKPAPSKQHEATMQSVVARVVLGSYTNVMKLYVVTKKPLPVGEAAKMSSMGHGALDGGPGLQKNIQELGSWLRKMAEKATEVG